MLEFIYGMLVGGGVVGAVMVTHCYATRSKRIAEQEKDYALLQQHVDKCVDVIERIIYRGK